MLGWAYQSSPLIERKGIDYFEPVHPQPLAVPNGLLQIILGARDNLIGNWLDQYYTSGCDSFRIMGRQVVLANRPDAVQQVLVTENAKFERKGPQVRRALEGVIGNGLFISDGPLWAARRPVVAEALHKGRMAAFGSAMETVTSEFCTRWDAVPEGTVLNVQLEMAELTAEILTRAVFGSRISADEVRHVAEGFTSFQNQVDSFNIGYFLGFDEGLKIRSGRNVRRAVAKLHKVVDRVVQSYLETDDVEDSILYRLVSKHEAAGDRERGVKALYDEAMTIFLAGHETTAIILTWAWYLLANAPWVEREIHAEIASVAGDRPVGFADVPKLAWCRSVIEETMRLYPPIPIYTRQARAESNVAGIAVEKGALVMVVPWLLHRARDLWDEPDLFRPERFLAGRPSAFSYIPFSVGPRVCAGVSFGMTEAVLCLAMLAQRFIVRPTSDPVVPTCRLTLRPRGGLPVTIARRA